MSIIIPTYNKLDRLLLVLKSLEGQVENGVEVIVVFDGCEERVVEAFHKETFSYQPIAIICPENHGRAAARNKGISVANGEIVTFVDDDRIVDRHFVEEHLRIHDSIGKPIVVLGARRDILLDNEEIKELGENFDRALEKLNAEACFEDYPFPKSKKHFFRFINFFTGNVSVNRKLIESIDGFDENIKTWGGEDNDVGIQLQLKKAEFYYNNDAINYHLAHESNFLYNKEEHIKNIRYLIQKYNGHPVIKRGLTMMCNRCAIVECIANEELFNKFKELREKGRI